MSALKINVQYTRALFRNWQEASFLTAVWCSNSRKQLWFRQFSATLCPRGEIQLWRRASCFTGANCCNLGVNLHLSYCPRNTFMQHSAFLKLSIAGIAECFAESWCWQMQPVVVLLVRSLECAISRRGGSSKSLGLLPDILKVSCI